MAMDSFISGLKNVKNELVSHAQLRGSASMIHNHMASVYLRLV
jgi:hypothetical protein